MACPGFAKPLSDALRRNQRGTAVLIGFTNVMAVGLTAGTLGIAQGTLAVPVVLTTLSENCDGGDTLKASALQASQGASVMALTAGVATVLAAAGIITVPLSFPLATISAVSVALSEIFAAIGKGQAPTSGMINALLEGLKKFEGMPSAEISQLQSFLNQAAKKGKTMAVYSLEDDAKKPLRALVEAAKQSNVSDFRPAVVGALPALIDTAEQFAVRAQSARKFAEVQSASSGIAYLVRLKKTPETAWSYDEAMQVINDPASAPQKSVFGSKNTVYYIVGAVVVVGIGVAIYKATR